MTILPTVLFLITGVLRETAIKTADNSVPVPVAAALQGIKTIVTSPLARSESIQTQWTGLVRSSLASVLEYLQPGKQRVISLCSDSRWPPWSFLVFHLSPVSCRRVQTRHGRSQHVDGDHALPAVGQQRTRRSRGFAERLHGSLPERPELERPVGKNRAQQNLPTIKVKTNRKEAQTSIVEAEMIKTKDKMSVKQTICSRIEAKRSKQKLKFAKTCSSS